MINHAELRRFVDNECIKLYCCR